MDRISPELEQESVSTKFIVWKDEYSVGSTELDSHHKIIIDIINTIYDYLQGSTQSLDMDCILEELVNYTEAHFADEENSLIMVNYPDFKEHKRQHDWMSQRSQAIRAEYLKWREDLSMELLNFLKKWWISHIRDSDAQYAPYLK